MYERALRDPDSLVSVDIIGDEAFGCVAGEIYEEKTGKPVPRSEAAHPTDPVGDDWDFEDAEEAERRLPKTAARFGA